MAIIGRIRKHSGLAVIIVGVAIAAFVIGDFGKKRVKGTNEVGYVNGEAIPYTEFSNKVEEYIQVQKDNSGNDKITDEETFSIRQSTWNNLVKEILMEKEYDNLGIAVSSDELFDQVQGPNPHRFILQYFKDPKTHVYDPQLVRNYLKNLDNMEAKAKDQWLRFEKAIKDDRLENKYNNLIKKGYYVPKAFLKRLYAEQTQTLKIRYFAPPLSLVSDSTTVVTDADYQKFYDENKWNFLQEEPTRTVNYLLFEVKASDADRKKTMADVLSLNKEFIASNDLPNFINANSDKKYDSTFKKKGNFPGILDSTALSDKPGTFYAPFEINDAWYMAKLLDIQERPDTMKGEQIMITFAGSALKDENVKRTKEQAKTRADSLFTILKKTPERFREFAVNYSDFPTAKDDGGELKEIIDGQPNFALFFNEGLNMKPKDMKVVETGIGYAIFRLTTKSKPIKKAKMAILQRNIEPSNQTFQDTYLKASAFAGTTRTKEAFAKAATEKGLAVRASENIREMDNFLSGLSSAREVVRWSFSEKTKIGDISPVFDLTGKYVVAMLTGTAEKGYMTLEKVHDGLTQAVRNEKKISILGDQLKKSIESLQNFNQLAMQFRTKVDTSNLIFGGYNNNAIGRDPEVIGRLFTAKQGVLQGPLKGKYGVYVVIIDNIVPAAEIQDYTSARMQQESTFVNRSEGMIYDVLKKTAKIQDFRRNFF
ncbi:MAG: SurA N-terminal domain-containing protein [Bacteroidetes bacterium]|nr:SurA N-terminal domain-containing protein [Bacteroidota bacterium]